jgi:hypothetical protein
MFCWGNHQGGRRWCAYLATEKDGDYVEVQAGLAPTQLNSIDIPANTHWSYTQAIGELYTAGIAAAYNEDYPAARLFVEQELHKTLPVERMQTIHGEYKEKAALPAAEILSGGSGWGALEQLRAEKAGERGAPESLSFPLSAIGEAEAPWYLLLTKGYIAETSVLSVPRSWMVDNKFRALLEESMKRREGNHYLSKLYLGVLLYEQGERDEGARLWKESAEQKASPVALRNLACHARLKGDSGSAVSYMKQAAELEGNKIDKVFTEEYLDTLLSQKKYAQAWDYYRDLPPDIQRADKVSVLAGLAAVRLDEFGFVEELLQRDFACIREGDNSLTDIFFLWQARKLMKEKGMDEKQAEAYVNKNITPPSHIDFRMFVKG